MHSRFGYSAVNFMAVTFVFLKCAQASDRVVGFERAIYIPAQEPFWKYLESFNNICLGVLLTRTEVLTTCDCLTEVKGIDQRMPSYRTEIQNGLRVVSPSVLRIRTHEVSRGESEFINTTEIKIHPLCNGWGGYDYAMARLKTPVNGIRIRLTENYFPYSEAIKQSYHPEGHEPECYVSTFIKETRDWREPPKKLAYSDTGIVPVSITDTEECREFINYNPNYAYFDWGSKICVEANSLAPICQGDVGVPLICNETLIGIVTVNEMFCEWNSALNIVSSITAAQSFIDQFIKEGNQVQYWTNKAQEVLNSLRGLAN